MEGRRWWSCHLPGSISFVINRGDVHITEDLPSFKLFRYLSRVWSGWDFREAIPASAFPCRELVQAITSDRNVLSLDVWPTFIGNRTNPFQMLEKQFKKKAKQKLPGVPSSFWDATHHQPTFHFTNMGVSLKAALVVSCSNGNRQFPLSAIVTANRIIDNKVILDNRWVMTLNSYFKLRHLHIVLTLTCCWNTRASLLAFEDHAL